MADKHILHMVTPLKHMSPFDVNMAVDAGYDIVFPYTDVKLEEITGLVQDSIFSRPPKIGARTAMFIGRTGILLLERGEFDVDIFYLVIVGNYTMCEAFSIRGATCEGVLADVSKRTLVSEVYGQLNT